MTLFSHHKLIYTQIKLSCPYINVFVLQQCNKEDNVHTVAFKHNFPRVKINSPYIPSLNAYFENSRVTRQCKYVCKMCKPEFLIKDSRTISISWPGSNATLLHPEASQSDWHSRRPIKSLQFASSDDVSATRTCANQHQPACNAQPMSAFQRAALWPIARLHDGEAVTAYIYRRAQRHELHLRQRENTRNTETERDRQHIHCDQPTPLRLLLNSALSGENHVFYYPTKPL